MPTDYGENQDSSLGTSTTDSTNLSTGTDIYSLLNALYGQNPFGAIHTGMGGEERAYSYGPLHWLTEQIGNATDAAMFVNNVINALLAQGIDLDQVGPAGITMLVQQMWQTPAIRQKFLLAPSPTSVQTLVRQTMGGTTGASDYAAKVPTPFDPSIFANPNNLTETFKQTPGELGNDYAMNPGTRLYAPFAGTISTEDSGKANWGKRVFIHLDNGWTIAIGHMNAFDVVSGQRVNPGDLLGLSGGALSDPSSGNSTGPHIEFQVIAPGGRYVDPRPYLQQIFGGVSFAQMSTTFGLGILGAGISATAARDRLLGRDPILDAKYGEVRSLWQKYFGVDPTAEQMMGVIGHGMTPQQWEDYIRTLPSHMKGINIGSYFDIRQLADSAFQKVYGNPSNDQVVKDLFDKGLTSVEGIGYYIDQLPFQPGKDVSPIVYNAVYGSAAQYSQAIWNQPPDPRDMAAMHQAAGAPSGLPATQTVQVADTLKPRLDVIQGEQGQQADGQ